MISFGSLFNSMNRTSTTPINNTLHAITPLQQILDTESFINDYKSGNAQIYQYMTYSRYKQLIKYVTVQGPINDKKKGFKYPMIAADMLSTQNSNVFHLFLPKQTIQVDVEYYDTEQFQLQVDDSDQQYLIDQNQPNHSMKQSNHNINQLNNNTKQPNNNTSSLNPNINQLNNHTRHNEVVELDVSNNDLKEEQNQFQILEIKKKTKIVKSVQQIKKIKKQPQQPLIIELMQYFKGPFNYTLAGYVSKVLSIIFIKQPNELAQYFYKLNSHLLTLMYNHIESRSVGDFICTILLSEKPYYLLQRLQHFHQLVFSMSQTQQSHILQSTSLALQQIIEKAYLFIKTKSTVQNATIVQTYRRIVFNKKGVSQIIKNMITQNQSIAKYNSVVLLTYLKNSDVQILSQIQVNNLFDFCDHIISKLRNISNTKQLGLERIKILQIINLMISRFNMIKYQQPKIEQRYIRQTKQLFQQKQLQNQIQQKQESVKKEKLQQLHETIDSIFSKNTDFFQILIKLVKQFPNNNMLHNQVFKLIQLVIQKPIIEKSQLQALLLNQNNIILKFISQQAQIDRNLNKQGLSASRKGYIAHIINLCGFMQQFTGHNLLQNLQNSQSFHKVLSTLIYEDYELTSQNLGGFRLIKDEQNQIMFSIKQVVNFYQQFLAHIPNNLSPQQKPKPMIGRVNKQLASQTSTHAKQLGQNQQRNYIQSEQKLNQAFAKLQAINAQSDIKYWNNYANYDLQQLMQDLL